MLLNIMCWTLYNYYKYRIISYYYKDADDFKIREL